MIVLLTTILGGGYGAWLARRRQGNRYDIAQYAAVFAMIGAILGLIAAIWLQRAG